MDWIDRAGDVMRVGGWAMYPLLLLSFLSLTFSLERAMFWMSTNRRAGRRRFARVLELLRSSTLESASDKLVGERGLYARFARDLLAMVGSSGDDERFLAAVAHELIDRYRPVIERFSGTLSTIITAAPMIGILGTVTGIIHSFQLLGSEGPVTDPTAVAGGVAEALFTTAFGLVVALLTLFPYAWIRRESERCLGRLEALCAAAHAGAGRMNKRS
ncbi:MAG: MotA/TolQ/ExbB proton channel family protein [Planctomycetota bacterium]|nr:MAG: MotA/TolQ/ExbB proton channel family protein [Planctomycetota bacterium]